MNGQPQRLRDVWNWLPAFREVARAPHLPTASKRLHLTPSALSRTIRLLEDRVGHDLFNRVGRTLVLNTAGERLLRAVERAAGGLDTALASLSSDPLNGPVRISSLGVLTNSYVLPALLGLKGQHEGLEPEVSNFTPREANERLASGEIDVAFYYDALTHDDLIIDRIGVSTASVYCGPEHPLFRAKRPTVEEILAHPFSVPQIGDRGVSMDGWPVDVPRRIGMRITLLYTNLEIALSGSLLTVLPDVVAHSHTAERRLRRLPIDVVPPVELFAARRRNDAAHTASTLIADAVTARVREVDKALSRRSKKR